GAFSYDLPNVESNGFVNALLRHWGLDDRLTFRSGFPIDVSGTTQFDPVTGGRITSGLDLVPGQPIYLYGSQCACPGGRAINPDAFEPAVSGLGDVPRNSIRGFGAWQIDMAVRREFSIHQRLKLQFRAEAYNTLNHPNFGDISRGC